MPVFRIEKTKDFTVMSNHHLRNSEISLKAKGLLSQMLSLRIGTTRWPVWRQSIWRVLTLSEKRLRNWKLPDILPESSVEQTMGAFRAMNM